MAVSSDIGGLGAYLEVVEHHRGYVLDLGRNRFEGTGAALLHDPKVIDLYLGGTARIDAVPG